MNTETLAEDVPRRGGSLQMDLSIHMPPPSIEARVLALKASHGGLVRG